EMTRSYLLRRITADGAPDETFAGGTVALDFQPAHVQATAGGTVTVGGRSPGGYFAMLARYTASGDPDPSFGDNGSLTVLTVDTWEDDVYVLDIEERAGGGLFVLVAEWSEAAQTTYVYL